MQLTPVVFPIDDYQQEAISLELHICFAVVLLFTDLICSYVIGHP